MIQTNVASLSAYCVRACKIKHLTEREFSGIFSLAGGNFAFSKREFPVALVCAGLQVLTSGSTNLPHRDVHTAVCTCQSDTSLFRPKFGLEFFYIPRSCLILNGALSLPLSLSVCVCVCLSLPLSLTIYCRRVVLSALYMPTVLHSTLSIRGKNHVFV